MHRQCENRQSSRNQHTQPMTPAGKLPPGKQIARSFQPRRDNRLNLSRQIHLRSLLNPTCTGCTLNAIHFIKTLVRIDNSVIANDKTLIWIDHPVVPTKP